MRNNKYITTTLPYANSPAHIGHAFEFIIADALARYFKYQGELDGIDKYWDRTKNRQQFQFVSENNILI